MKGNQYREYGTLTCCCALAILRLFGDEKVVSGQFDCFPREVVVVLNECRIRRLGHDGSVNNRFHHGRKDGVDVSEQVEWDPT